MAKTKQTFNPSISGTRKSSSIKSISFFDNEYIEEDKSPIDLFNAKKQNNLRLLGASLLDPTTGAYTSLAAEKSAEWQQLSNLLILGFVSSVESYFRCVIRRLISIDEHSRKLSYKHMLPYGAAMYHHTSLLPEALLESTSFHNSKNIKETVNKFTGISLNDNKYKELADIFDEFDIVGHLRHCVVHRSGHLGSTNAMALGLDEHYIYLEKPIHVDLPAIQEIGLVCENLIRVVNDVLFAEVLLRSSKYFDWTGDLRKDKKNFALFFNLFSPESADKDKKLKSCYIEFISVTNAKVKTR
ncbi:hypothetical protein [Pseudoalteromonas sp. SCSIO 43101]|uniref:hypothetical protein n=1 Tax=Pseudoalteromonas sp. SCSIO 43101 TaxID=2822847 RepID=UPI00202ACD9D|nr:hypothetical protein [Pseudoalteromonas sp. SCSIO 43101]URQ90760.1 hypothetical protein J8Z25_01845 [Pseudoalteromonas sp. SCSIO 43101]